MPIYFPFPKAIIRENYIKLALFLPKGNLARVSRARRPSSLVSSTPTRRTKSSYDKKKKKVINQIKLVHFYIFINLTQVYLTVAIHLKYKYSIYYVFSQHHHLNELVLLLKITSLKIQYICFCVGEEILLALLLSIH